MKIFITISILFIALIGNTQNINFIKSYGNNGYDYGRDIKQDVDTGYIATGSSSSFTSENADAFLLKVDSLGNFKWSYNYGGQGAEWGEAVVVTLDSAYAVGGYTNSYGAGGFDFYLVRTNNVGVPLWEKTYGGTDWERAHDMVQLPDSGFVLVGETYSYGNGNMDVYIVRTDKNGDTLWTKTYGGTEDDYANAVLLDGDSLVVVGGTTSFGAGMTDGLILKYHIDGTFGWSKVDGRDKDDYFTSITKNYNNGQYILGGTRNYNHHLNCDCGQDFWMYYLSNIGMTVADTSFSNDQFGTDITHDVAFDSQTNSMTYGGSTTSWGPSDIAQGFTNTFLAKQDASYGYVPYVGNVGFEKDDAIYAIDTCFDDGIVVIGNLDFSSTGGANLFIARIDKDNTNNGFLLNSELTNENITLSFLNISENKSLNVYPSLFSNHITIEGLSNTHSVNIYDLSGKLIYQNSNNQTVYDLSELNSGIYILTITTKDGQYSTKIVKE